MLFTQECRLTIALTSGPPIDSAAAVWCSAGLGGTLSHRRFLLNGLRNASQVSVVTPKPPENRPRSVELESSDVAITMQTRPMTTTTSTATPMIIHFMVGLQKGFKRACR